VICALCKNSPHPGTGSPRCPPKSETSTRCDSLTSAPTWLKALPKELGRLTALETLRVGGNSPLTVPPTDVVAAVAPANA